MPTQSNDPAERELPIEHEPQRRSDGERPAKGQLPPLWGTVDVGSMVPPAGATQESDSELPAEPDFVSMAVSAAMAMAKFTASGFRRVSQSTHAARSEQCDRCKHLDGTRCHLCGCFADMKAWLPHEDCPVGRWPL